MARIAYHAPRLLDADELLAFVNVTPAVTRVLLDEGMMSVIAEFVGTCQHLDATCSPIMEVNRVSGQYILTKHASMKLVSTIRYNLRPTLRLKNPISQCRVKLVMSWDHFSNHLEVMTALRVVHAQLLGVSPDTELLEFLPYLEVLNIGQAQLLNNLNFLRSLPKLRELKLQGLRDVDVTPLDACPNLRVLKLPKTRISEESLLRICTSHPDLQVLHIPHPAATFHRLVCLTTAQRIGELNIQGRTDQNYVPLLCCSRLTTLEISYVQCLRRYIPRIHSLRTLILHASKSVRHEVQIFKATHANLEIRVIYDE